MTKGQTTKGQNDKIFFDLNHRKLAILITKICQTFLKIKNVSLILASIMVGLATFFAARQCGRIIVDEQGYYYKKTSVNKMTSVSKKEWIKTQQS